MCTIFKKHNYLKVEQHNVLTNENEGYSILILFILNILKTAQW